MGKLTGFLEFGRELPQNRDPKSRIEDSKEIQQEFGAEKLNKQAARCMDCGVPFCHNGCPLGNNIPEFNDAVYKNDWEEAAKVLFSTNNFPEFTGRICPAPCETSCVLGINKPPVTIEQIEKEIAEKAFELGLIQPNVPKNRTGKNVAVIGSGPAGLAAAAQLNSVGHMVNVYERANRIGGLLTYGIPDFKLEKRIVERRIKHMRQEGIVFKTNCTVGENVKTADILDQYDAVLVCTGSTVPRDMPVHGRDLDGIHFAMDFLTQENQRVAGDKINAEETILATDKHVLVIGGGDTGSDCVGTSHRQKAKSVTQIELLENPPLARGESDPWPLWPVILRTSSSQEEGGKRQWALNTKAFHGTNGKVSSIELVEVEWMLSKNGKQKMVEVENSTKTISCDLALLAIGFLHPQRTGLIQELGVELDNRGNVLCENHRTSVDKVFAAGDARRGQSLVVWAISEGREAARSVDEFLMGVSVLESKNRSLLSV
jgi:glutamate synthase (NADPH/NADH) small chain